MSSIAKSSISFSKKDQTKSRINPIASKNIFFYHKANSGDKTINLLSLTMPSSEMPTAVQASIEEINGCKLYTNKKNLSLVSSVNGELIQGLDFVISSATTIELIGVYGILGAEPGEIFIGKVNAVPLSDLTVTSAKSFCKTYTLLAGQTLLNLGREYATNINVDDNVGSIKVFIDGVLALRGTNYSEYNPTNGYSSAITFLAPAPFVSNKSIVVDFGVMTISDINTIGTIENLSGSIKKIADDLSTITANPASGYYAASPSDIERRTFGDSVLSLLSRTTTLETKVTALENKVYVPIGSLMESMLTLAQFQTIMGSGWVLADGGSCVGSAYGTLTGNTTVPDARGVVLRGKNNGRLDGKQNPDGDVSLGTYQSDEFKSHNHTYNEMYNTSPNNGGQGQESYHWNPRNQSSTTGSSGGNETRMKNITVNIFIKIN